jgi:hypothetical protein
MHGTVDPDFRSRADHRPVKNTSPSGNEDFVSNLGTNYMAVSADEAIVAVTPATSCEL